VGPFQGLSFGLRSILPDPEQMFKGAIGLSIDTAPPSASLSNGRNDNCARSTVFPNRTHGQAHG
jgi:hypothetical protein